MHQSQCGCSALSNHHKLALVSHIAKNDYFFSVGKRNIDAFNLAKRKCTYKSVLWLFSKVCSWDKIDFSRCFLLICPSFRAPIVLTVQGLVTQGSYTVSTTEWILSNKRWELLWTSFKVCSSRGWKLTVDLLLPQVFPQAPISTDHLGAWNDMSVAYQPWSWEEGNWGLDLDVQVSMEKATHQMPSILGSLLLISACWEITCAVSVVLEESPSLAEPQR